jgi:hypothetical protein
VEEERDGSDDRRAADPPAREQPEHDPGEGEPAESSEQAPGPRGNPATDEEALRQRQQRDE